MSSAGVDLDGLPELVARLGRARSGIVDLSDVNADIADTVASRATPPRKTGALANSQKVTVTGTGWGIGYGATYAVPVHYGTRILAARPWLTTAAKETDQVAMVTEHIQKLLND